MQAIGGAPTALAALGAPGGIEDYPVDLTDASMNALNVCEWRGVLCGRANTGVLQVRVRFSHSFLREDTRADRKKKIGY